MAYDREELAWSVVPENERPQFALYAYWLFPVLFERGQESALELPTLQVQSLAQNFSRLGYDVVSRNFTSVFQCSPLSCNSMAQSHRVNRFCLLEMEKEAFHLAREFSITEPEPGPYCVVEVWR